MTRRFLLLSGCLVSTVISCAPPPGPLIRQVETSFATSQAVTEVLAAAQRVLTMEAFEEIKSDNANGTLVATRRRVASESGPQVTCSYGSQAAVSRATDLTLKLQAVRQADSTVVTITAKVRAYDQTTTALGVARSANYTDCHSSKEAEENIRNAVDGRMLGRLDRYAGAATYASRPVAR